MERIDAISVGFLIASFVVVLGFLISLRAKHSQLEIRPTEVLVAVLPVAIFLLVTGKIQKVEVGGVKVETAFVKATNSAITSQVAPLAGLPSEPIQTDPKGGPEGIPPLIEKKTQGLLFRLGNTGYYGPVILQYLTTLTRQPFLRYVIIENSDSTFFAMADARALSDLLSSQSPPYSADNFADWLNSADKNSLKRLPGFLSLENAVTEKTDKGQALQVMESHNADTLPVVNESQRFVGIVNRSRLTASWILDLAKELKP